MFDYASSFSIRMLRSMDMAMTTGAKFSWGIDDIKALESVHEKLKFKSVTSRFEEPLVSQFPMGLRLACYIASWLPVIRYSNQNAHYEF